MLSGAEKKAAIQLVESCFHFHNRNGRLISTPFEDLPDQSNLAYYQKVPNPTSLKIVLNGLKQDLYPSLKQFYTELKLVFSNTAFVVNKSTRDWQDAVRMDQFVDESWDQRAQAGWLPSLDDLFSRQSPDSGNPAISGASTSRANSEADETATAQPVPDSASAPKPPPADRKRSRSASSDSAGSGEDAKPSAPAAQPTAVSSTSKAAGSKRTKKADEDGPTPAKERSPDLESGWLKTNEALSAPALATFILTRLKNERLPAAVSPLDATARPGALSDTTIAQDSPLLSFDRVESALAANSYGSLEAFDQALSETFAEAEKAYASNPDRLGGIYVLKRLYQELTQGDGSLALKQSVPVGGARRLASVAMGPGNRHTLPRNEESSKLKAKEKAMLEGIRFKGDYFRIGDWVHLFNPDDPGRPIVAQIFNTYRRLDNGRRAVNVCWYYRPEETVHHISRTFLQNEVFKTGNFLDHVVEDVLGRCLVLFYTRYLRGRPASPHWTPEMPTYICEHRYKDDDYQFKKIKNWDSCVPSTLRNEEVFRPYPSPQPATGLVRVLSPFLAPPDKRAKASGEPIVVAPDELAKEMPKDQVKYHDALVSLESIRQVLGELPSGPRRPPHVIEATEDSASQPARRSRAAVASPPGAVSSAPPSAPAALPQAPPTQLTQPQPTKTLDFSSSEVFELLGHQFGGPHRRAACLLDLFASQEQFEKLARGVIDVTENDEGEEGRATGPKEELMWFATPPLRKPDQNEEGLRKVVRHSAAYLAFRRRVDNGLSVRVGENGGCENGNKSGEESGIGKEVGGKDCT